MPEHLEEIKINIDTDLRDWEFKYKEEYVNTRARLQKCVAPDQQAALKNQREVVVLKDFPTVGSCILAYPHTKPW